MSGPEVAGRRLFLCDSETDGGGGENEKNKRTRKKPEKKKKTSRRGIGLIIIIYVGSDLRIARFAIILQTLLFAQLPGVGGGGGGGSVDH